MKKKILLLVFSLLLLGVPLYSNTQPVLDQAENIGTDTTDFNNALSSVDDDVQKALDTLDNVIIVTETDPLSLHLDQTTPQTVVGTPEFPDLKITELPLNGSSYSTVHDVINYTASAGVIDPKDNIIVNGGSETVNTIAIKIAIKTSNSHVGVVKTFDFASTTGNSIPTDTIKYVGIEYNGGSPQIVLKDVDSWNEHDEFALGIVVNEGGELHIFNNPQHIANSPGRLLHRFYETLPLQRADRLGGIILGETGTRNVVLTAGELYDRVNEFIINAIDTSSGDTFDIYYRDGVGGFTKVVAQTQWPNGAYDDNSGILQSLGVNRYSNLWFYIESDGDLVILYGTSNAASLATAEAEAPPSNVPLRIQAHGKLIGRILFRAGENTAIDIQSVFGTAFNSTGVINHNELSGIQGGTINEYFHLTSSEHTELSSWLDDVVLSDGGGVNLGTGGLSANSLSDGTASLTGGSLTSVKLGSLTGNGFVKTSGGDGTLSIDTNTYLTTESDTLDTVADRGATTDKSLTIGDSLTFSNGESFDNAVNGTLKANTNILSISSLTGNVRFRMVNDQSDTAVFSHDNGELGWLGMLPASDEDLYLFENAAAGEHKSIRVYQNDGSLKYMNITAGAITDTSGAISFDNENLLTTGTLGAGAITGTSLKGSGLTSGRLPQITTGGLLTDNAGLTYSGANVTSTGTIKGATLSVNATASHTLTNSSNDLVITNLNSDKDLIFSVNDGGTQKNIWTFDTSKRQLAVNPGTIQLPTGEGLIDFTGTYTIAVVGTAFAYRPTINSSGSGVVFYVNPTLGSGTNSGYNVEGFRLAPQGNASQSGGIGFISGLNFMPTAKSISGGSQNFSAVRSSIVAGLNTSTTTNLYGLLYESKGDFGGSYGAIELGAGTLNEYGLYVTGMEALGGGYSNSYVVWADAGKIALAADGTGLLSSITLGAAEDASIYYDATNLVIKPDNVGSGLVHISTAQANALKIGAGTAGIDYTITVDGETNDGTITYMEDEDRLDFDGGFKAADYYSGDGSQGITDSASYWLCTAADCSSSCQVTIKDGLITGCP